MQLFTTVYKLFADAATVKQFRTQCAALHLHSQHLPTTFSPTALGLLLAYIRRPGPTPVFLKTWQWPWLLLTQSTALNEPLSS